MGVPANGNTPRGRFLAESWTDKAGNLWLSSGRNYSGDTGFWNWLNDLWEFNLATHQWTWMGGSSNLTDYPEEGPVAVKGTLGIPSAGNIPGGRDSAVSWTDKNGNLWLFGGMGFDLGDANDLWVYQPTSGKLPVAPTISWAVPTPITYGTGLSATQLNASATFDGTPVTGTYSYSPSFGAVLTAGSQTLTVNFTPSDTTNYNNASQSVTLTVNKSTPTITWSTPSAITYGTALSGTQLNATSSVPGTFIYTPAAGAVLTAGPQTLTATFTPTDTTNYNNATGSVSLTVNKATPVITWVTPASITAGTSLSGTQLNATANVPGTFSYSPAAGTVMSTAGTFTLSTTFTPTDTINYNTATSSVSLVVTVVNPTPNINGISPALTSVGSPTFVLTVTGSGFLANSTVYWGAASLSTQYVSATQLTAQVPASNVATAGTATVTVQTPAPGGGNSNSFQFEIDSASSGSVTPPSFTTQTSTVTAGSAATYPVTLPTSATNISAACLNLPAGATCSYSSSTKLVTINTSSTTPAGTFQITIVFTETLPGAATAFVLLPILLLPLIITRRKWTMGRTALMTCLGIVAVTLAVSLGGCGGGGGGSSSNPPPSTHQATSSGVVSLTVR